MKLDKEEQELLQSLESGEWESIDNLESEIAEHRLAAKKYFKKRSKD